MIKNACFFASFKLIEIIKRCENDPNSIKTIGYSSFFLVKNDQKGMFFAPFKLIEN
jgi:hypothetical protein